MKTIKNIIRNASTCWVLTFCISFVLSITLLVISFFLPPTGQIDPSVIQSVGVILIFPTILGIYECVKEALARGVDAKVSKGDISVEITNPDKKDD